MPKLIELDDGTVRWDYDVPDGVKPKRPARERAPRKPKKTAAIKPAVTDKNRES